MRVSPRFASLLFVGAIGTAFAWDATRPPPRQWTTRAAVGVIHVYQRTASRLMPAVGVTCRFSPTCSRYAAVVLERHGILRGTALTVVRLARCGPWTPSGTKDLPP
jgi:putative membrane protein insertion efficiency factor